jgi:hypothetical protein
VVKGSPVPVPLRTPQRANALAKLPAVPILANPPESSLPDLVPLPAWGIRTSHVLGRDLIDFSATVIPPCAGMPEQT